MKRSHDGTGGRRPARSNGSERSQSMPSARTAATANGPVSGAMAISNTAILNIAMEIGGRSHGTMRGRKDAAMKLARACSATASCASAAKGADHCRPGPAALSLAPRR